MRPRLDVIGFREEKAAGGAGGPLLVVVAVLLAGLEGRRLGPDRGQRTAGPQGP
jgi:hypothetical protein